MLHDSRGVKALERPPSVRLHLKQRLPRYQLALMSACHTTTRSSDLTKQSQILKRPLSLLAIPQNSRQNNETRSILVSCWDLHALSEKCRKQLPQPNRCDAPAKSQKVRHFLLSFLPFPNHRRYISSSKSFVLVLDHKKLWRWERATTNVAPSNDFKLKQNYKFENIENSFCNQTTRRPLAEVRLAFSASRRSTTCFFCRFQSTATSKSVKQQ